MPPAMLRSRLALHACLCLLAGAPAHHAEGGEQPHVSPAPPPDAAQRVLDAYPAAIAAVDGNWLLWRDGTRMPLDDGKTARSFSAWLDAPDILDMLRIPYPAGSAATAPAFESDPGRARNAAFFDRMYGDCRQGQVKPKLATITWLPTKAPQRLAVTTVNGVDKRLDAISRELDRLPAAFDAFLIPAAGTYNCRTIAGTSRVSAHGYGIAIDIAVSRSDYWRWAPGRGSGRIAYRNRVPLEIVRIFERHGFIWGGRWYHYDTMHFEYRPELLPGR